MNNSLFIKSIIIFLGLDSNLNNEIVNNVNIRLQLLKPIYRIPIFVLINILLLVNALLFFVSSDKYFDLVIKIFNYLGGPFALLIKLLTSYVLLEYYEKN